jgi:gamma-glutamylputrescine oxidase
MLSRRALLKRAGLASAGVASGGLALNALAPRLWPERTAVDQNDSFWSRAVPPANPPLRDALDADVAIVGGGLTGLSCAYYLRRRLPGRSVVVLEAKRCGNGASARNGAMLLPSTGDRYLVPTAHAALDRRIHELTIDNIARLRALEAEFGGDAEIDGSGALQALLSDEQARRADADGARLRDRGIPIEYWNRERTRAALGTPAYAGALFDPSAGQLHPGKLVALWKRAAEAVGARIYEGTAVADIPDGRNPELTTASGHRVRARVLVLATNAYSSRLGFLRHSYAPVWSYVGITPPLPPDILAASGWSVRAPFDDSLTELHYLGLTRDHRVHIGGGPVDYLFNDGAPTPALAAERYRALHLTLGQLFPALSQLAFEATWCGAVDMSLDAAPSVGRLDHNPSVYYAIGYSGHGVNLTSVFGRVLADLIAGRDDDWRWLPYLNRTGPLLPNEPWRWLGIRARLAAIRAFE